MSDQTHKRLQSMLKWSLSVQGDTDNTHVTEMDEERRQWLKECLESLANEPTETDLLKAALTVLKTQYSTQTSEINNKLLDAFEQLQYLVEDLDHANDLIPLKGVETIVRYLHHSESDLQICACDVIAAATQNFPKCQEAFIFSLSQLLHLIKEDNTCDGVKVKAIYAVSGIVRGNSNGLKEFEKQNGISCLLNCLSSKTKKIIIKVCFIFQALYQEPDDVLITEGINVLQTLLKHLLVSTDDVEIQGIYCVTVNIVTTTVPGSNKILKERRREILPILNVLKDKMEEVDSAKEIIKDLIVMIDQSQ